MHLGAAALTDRTPHPATGPLSGTIASGLVALTVVLLAVVVVRCAWVGDDAYFTFRTVDNFVDGYGPRFNIAERVQAYTHPLWMFCVAVPCFLGVSCFWSCLVVSFLCTAAVAVLVARLHPLGAGVLPLAMMACSKAFVDYSTSGLENPLNHLLVILFCLLWMQGILHKDRVWPLGLAASAMMLNRLDTLLIVLPALAYILVERRSWSVAKQLALSFLPLVAWEAFSLIYYGSLLPNTYYAKMVPETDRLECLSRGWVYVVESSRHDWLTVPVIVGAAMIPLLSKRIQSAPIVAGMILYVAYMFWIGGDFMAGRFFSVPFAMAAMIWATAGPAFGTRPWLVCGVAVVALGLASPRSPLLSGSGYGIRDYGELTLGEYNVADERLVYFAHHGMIRKDREGTIDPAPSPPSKVDPSAKLRALHMSAGTEAFKAPKNYFIVNEYGLSDPLTARLPPLPYWRVGHLWRDIPVGYCDSVEAGENRIRDPAIAALYDDVRLVVSGPIWSRARWAAIWRLNF